MDSALAIIGFYFTLIGFVSGLFFTRIDSWHGSVRGFHGRVGAYRERDDFIKADQEVGSLNASRPLGSFVAVGVFVTSLAVLALLFPVSDKTVNPLVFLYGPLLLTVAAYWLGGIVLLRQGKKLLSQVERRIEAGKKG